MLYITPTLMVSGAANEVLAEAKKTRPEIKQIAKTSLSDLSMSILLSMNFLLEIQNIFGVLHLLSSD
jgi:hypothetical protein